MWLRAGISWTFTPLTCHRFKYLEVAVTTPGTIVLASNVTAKAINNVHGNVSWIYKDHWLKKSIAEFFLVYKPWHLNCNIPYISTSGFCHGTNQVSFPLCWNQTLSIYFTNHFCSTRAYWYHDLSISSLSIPPFVRFTEGNKYLDEQIIFHVGKPPPIGKWWLFSTQLLQKLKTCTWLNFLLLKLVFLVSSISLIHYRDTHNGCPLQSFKLWLSVVLLRDQNDY